LRRASGALPVELAVVVAHHAPADISYDQCADGTLAITGLAPAVTGAVLRCVPAGVTCLAGEAAVSAAVSDPALSDSLLVRLEGVHTIAFDNWGLAAGDAATQATDRSGLSSPQGAVSTARTEVLGADRVAVRTTQLRLATVCPVALARLRPWRPLRTPTAQRRLFAASDATKVLRGLESVGTHNTFAVCVANGGRQAAATLL
jgi:hypothetical protein